MRGHLSYRYAALVFLCLLNASSIKAEANAEQEQQALKDQAARRQIQNAQQAQQSQKAQQVQRAEEAAAQHQAQRQAQQAQQVQQDQQRAQQVQRMEQAAAQHQAQQVQRDQQHAQEVQHAEEEAAVEHQAEKAQEDRQRTENLQRVKQAAQHQSAQQQQGGSLNREHGAEEASSRQEHNIQQERSSKRPSSRLPLNVSKVPLQTAYSIPNFAEHASPEQRRQAQIAEQNVRAHLIAVPISQAPKNYATTKSAQLNSYYNNTPIFLNNQQFNLTRQNTHYYPVQPGNYPDWYRPDNNWIYSNGFTFGNGISSGPDWLNFGWQPYYGESPTGFICASDYVPTPWIYEPVTNQWRQPGLNAYVDEGPSLDYTGPITVEVIEQVRGRHGRIINVPCLYDAFYYPEVDRWGYENRQGYFIWLDV